jgi:hypothetical protein
MLTAPVIGPEPVPMDWILQTVLSSPESEAIGFDDFPEYGWIAGRIEELHRRIGLVFQEGPEMFQLLVYMPNLEEGDTTPDSQTWCNGFVEGMAYNPGKVGAALCLELGIREDRSDHDDFRSGRMGEKGCFEPVCGVGAAGTRRRSQVGGSGNLRLLVSLRTESESDPYSECTREECPMSLRQRQEI